MPQHQAGAGGPQGEAQGPPVFAAWISTSLAVLCCDPYLRRIVSGGGGQAATVAGEGHAMDPTGVALEGEEFLAGLRVPHLRNLVRGGGGQAVAVGGEG